MCNLFMTEIIIIELGYSHIHGHAPSRLPVKMLRRLLNKRRKLRDFVSGLWKTIRKNIISYYSSIFTIINPQPWCQSVSSHSVLFSSGNERLLWLSSHEIYASVNSTYTQPPQTLTLTLTTPPPWATAGHLPALSVLGVGHSQILHCTGAGHLPTPGPFPSFRHAHGFLSEYNYTEGFTGKRGDWLICQGQE